MARNIKIILKFYIHFQISFKYFCYLLLIFQISESFKIQILSNINYVIAKNSFKMQK